MKINISILSMGLALICFSCSHSAKEDGLGHDHSHHSQEKSIHHEEDGHNHEHEHSKHEDGANEIVLEPSVAERFGVVCKKIVPQPFSEIVKVSGQISPAPGDQFVATAKSAGLVSLSFGIAEGKQVAAGASIASISAQNIAGGDANATAKVAVDAAKRELDRITPLHAEGIVSTKDYNAAKQAYEVALSAYSGSASGSTTATPISGVITQILAQHGEFVEVGQPIAVISKNTRLTLCADLPEKYYNFLPTIVTANFRMAYSDSIIQLKDVNGKIVTNSTITSPIKSGYIPVYFSFDNNGLVVPGAYAEIFLIGSVRQNAIIVPIDAIIEQQGKYYVYVRLDDECYEKRLVSVGMSNGREIEILSGLNIDENVVVHGAIIVKLAESSGAVPEGHSHNH